MRDQPIAEIEEGTDLDATWPALRDLFLELRPERPILLAMHRSKSVACWQGPGSALLRRCEHRCTSRGAREAPLNVVAANQTGVDFWNKSGFGITTHFMNKPLEVAP